MNSDEIKRSLRGLSYEDLQSIITLAQTLLAEKPFKEFPLELDLAYRALMGPLALKLGKTAPLGVLKKDTITEVRIALTYLMAWLKDAVGPVKRTEIPSWFSLFGELLVGFLEERQVPLSMITVIRQAKTLPSLIDDQFPGYLKAGLLKMVVQGLRNQNR